MKTILSVLLLVCVVGCNNYTPNWNGIHKAEKEKFWPSNHDPDTSIHQFVSTFHGYYYLQTIVKTERQQNIVTKWPEEITIIMEGDSYAPYNSQIKGTFEYIKTNKVIEYNKADSFVRYLRVKAVLDSIEFKKSLKGRQTDSAEYLKNLPIK